MTDKMRSTADLCSRSGAICGNALYAEILRLRAERDGLLEQQAAIRELVEGPGTISINGVETPYWWVTKDALRAILARGVAATNPSPAEPDLTNACIFNVNSSGSPLWCTAHQGEWPCELGDEPVRLNPAPSPAKEPIE